MRIRPVRLRAQLVTHRRPPSFRALNDLIASRQRLRQRIGFLLALCLPLGLLLLEFE
jgi:hypothetical protein